MEELSYRVIRSDRKTLGLEISDKLEVLVRVPRRLPEERIEAFVRQHERWILRKLEQRRAYLEQHTEPSAEQLSVWMAQARALIPDRVAYFSQIMTVRPTEIRFTKNKTRIGSCTRANQISFSCRLMDYPPEVLDYVVVHELAHILHKNHGPAFWRTVEAVLPDYRQRRKLLKR